MNDIEKDYNWEKDRTCIQRPMKMFNYALTLKRMSLMHYEALALKSFIVKQK